MMSPPPPTAYVGTQKQEVGKLIATETVFELED